MPQTVTKEYERLHTCGFPIRIEVVLEGVEVTQTKLSEVSLSCLASRVQYFRLCDSESLTHCPRCGEAFPQPAPAPGQPAGAQPPQGGQK